MTDDLVLPAIARVVDFETTGLPEEADSRIVEIGFVDVDIRDIAAPAVLPDTMRECLINPGVPIRAEISAIHHIVDADVANRPGIGEMSGILAEGVGTADIFVAHNAAMERHFWPLATGNLWVDTYKVALRAWPDAPAHNNQTLRYWLEQQGLIQLDRKLTEPTHRALPDAYVTAHILCALLKMGRPLSRLVELSSAPGFLPKLTFGKHAGTKFSEVELSYLDWIINKSDFDDPDVLFTANYWLKKRAA
jgi:exodeoxyribonuclease X